MWDPTKDTYLKGRHTDLHSRVAVSLLSFKPQNTKELWQETNTNMTVLRSWAKVQSVTFPSTCLIINRNLRPVSLQAFVWLHFRWGREYVCAPIYIFSFLRSSWGTAYDKNNRTGLNARTACNWVSALFAFFTNLRVCSTIQTCAAGTFFHAYRGLFTPAIAYNNREIKCIMFCLGILFPYLWCLVAVGFHWHTFDVLH